MHNNNNNNSNSNNENKVSVIIPTFNRAKLIEQAMNSVFSQTYRPIELLIVDDGSTDNTSEVINKWIQKNKEHTSFEVIYIYQKNSGAPVARNNGLKNSQGKYIQYLDSDDFIKTDKLGKQVRILQKEKTAICLSDYSIIDNEGNFSQYVSNDISIQKLISSFKGVSTSVPLIVKDSFTDNQLNWNTKLIKLQDIDYLIRLFMISDKVSYIEESLFTLVEHEGVRITTTNEKAAANFRQILKSIFQFHIHNLKNIKLKYYKSLVLLYCKLSWRSTGFTLPAFVKSKQAKV